MIITMITKIILAIIKSHHRNYTRQVGWTRGTSAERCVWTSSAWRLRRNKRWWAFIIGLDKSNWTLGSVMILPSLTSSPFSDWEDNDKVRRWLRLDFWSPLQLPRLWRASSSTETYQWWRSPASYSLANGIMMKHSWQIQRSKWAKQVGWLGQSTTYIHHPYQWWPTSSTKT